MRLISLKYLHLLIMRVYLLYNITLLVIFLLFIFWWSSLLKTSLFSSTLINLKKYSFSSNTTYTLPFRLFFFNLVDVMCVCVNSLFTLLHQQLPPQRVNICWLNYDAFFSRFNLLRKCSNVRNDQEQNSAFLPDLNFFLQYIFLYNFYILTKLMSRMMMVVV